VARDWWTRALNEVVVRVGANHRAEMTLMKNRFMVHSKGEDKLTRRGIADLMNSLNIHLSTKQVQALLVCVLFGCLLK
jgi:hypothetical protein